MKVSNKEGQSVWLEEVRHTYNSDKECFEGKSPTPSFDQEEQC